MTSRAAALILAGGQARRMGGADKPLLTLAGTSMLQRIIAALAMDDIAISANGDPARYRAFGLPVLDDGPFTDQGPLAGVLAGLDWAASIGAGSLLTVPGDTPFVPPGLAERLRPAPGCAASGGRVHHLVALWPVTCREALRAFLLADGSRQVRRFTATLPFHTVDFPVDRHDPFFNVNTPADLAEAREHATPTGTRGSES